MGIDELLGELYSRISEHIDEALDGLDDALLVEPPVTLAVRLISVADDDIVHAGQATYARGILERRAG